MHYWSPTNVITPALYDRTSQIPITVSSRKTNNNTHYDFSGMRLSTASCSSHHAELQPVGELSLNDLERQRENRLWVYREIKWRGALKVSARWMWRDVTEMRRAALLLSWWLNEAGGIELKCHAHLNPEVIKDTREWVPQVLLIPRMRQWVWQMRRKNARQSWLEEEVQTNAENCHTDWSAPYE